uniref:Maelstrom domain-containing protein n=1 Tax=Anopheles culicifacies TaxID=139723 RepID=A0A182M9N2_9DIPT
MRSIQVMLFLTLISTRLQTNAARKKYLRQHHHVPPQMKSGERREYVLQAKEYLDEKECLSVYYTLARERAELEAARCKEANKVGLMNSLFVKRLEDSGARHGTYLPAELAIIRYSLKGGVNDQLHMLIDPGVISLCDEYTALQHSKKTHALRIPPDALGLSDYDEIAEKILSFTAAKTQPTLLFTDADNVPIVEGMLDEFLEDHNEATSMLYVCSLAELFCKLQVAEMDPSSAVPSVEMVRKCLDEDVYSNTVGISCEFHESRGLVKHCALSQCVRWAYTLSNNCCPSMNIELLPGKHIPMDNQMGNDAVVLTSDASEIETNEGESDYTQRNANELPEQTPSRNESIQAAESLIPATPKKETRILKRLRRFREMLAKEAQK